MAKAVPISLDVVFCPNGSLYTVKLLL